jgi:hypothetical protein
MFGIPDVRRIANYYLYELIGLLVSDCCGTALALLLLHKAKGGVHEKV